MEVITIKDDVRVLYVQAESFPAGVMAAFEKLKAMIPDSDRRTYYGLSRPEDGVIEYKAAVEERTPGEGKKYNCDTIIIQSGRYISADIPDYMKAMQRFREVFQELLGHPGLDPEGYCVEWYFNEKDVKCMVRLRS